MTPWILSICTSAWLLCGSYVEAEYPTEAACYKALDELYKRQGAQNFKYVTCTPNKGMQSK
jgi:hypothetical protein